MAYNFDSIPSRRLPNIENKWTLYPRDVLPMWIADADFPCAPAIRAALHKQVDHGVFGYEWPPLRLRETVSARMKKLYGWEVDPDSVVYTAGVNNGYNIAARLLCSRNSGYMIQTPVYNEFHDAKTKVGVPQYSVPLVKKIEGRRIRYEVDFDAFEKAAKKAGMFLLCHPHNPVGHIYSRAELTRMAKICLENNVVVVSDEIHSELTLGGAAFMPMSGISRDAEKNTITLISASKAFNVPGLACAFAIIPNETLRKEFKTIADGMSFEVSTPGLNAARVAYSGKADGWLAALRRYLTANRDFIVNYVEDNLRGVRVTNPDATYLIWLDCSELNLNSTPYEFFLKNAKVALSDGGKFARETKSFVRLNFGTSRALIKQGLERMKKALSKF